MKCEFCNGDMSLEDLHCPHCGQLNKHAQQHIRDMKRYQGEFNETKEDVITVTQKYSQITVRCIIIVVLLIACVVTMVLGSSMYTIRRNMNRRAAERNKAENIKRIEAYIEDEDFISLNYFFESMDLNMYDASVEFAVYQPVQMVARQYQYVYMNIMSIYEHPESVEWNLDNLSQNLTYFYKYMDDTEMYYFRDVDPVYYEGPFEVMETHIKQLLVTYLGLTKDEADGLREMSEAKRVVLLEEKFENAE